MHSFSLASREKSDGDAPVAFDLHAPRDLDEDLAHLVGNLTSEGRLIRFYRCLKNYP